MKIVFLSTLGAVHRHVVAETLRHHPGLPRRPSVFCGIEAERVAVAASPVRTGSR